MSTGPMVCLFTVEKFTPIMVLLLEVFSPFICLIKYSSLTSSSTTNFAALEESVPIYSATCLTVGGGMFLCLLIS